MKKYQSYFWIAGVVIVLVGLMFLAAKGGSTIDPPFEVGVVHPLDYTKGNASSTVVITEYSDFQCPACRSYYLIVKQLAVEFGDRAIFVYRDFPLVQIHPNAEFASRVARAAGKQGKFWEMHDLLFEKQTEWGSTADIRPLFQSYAELLGLDIEQFNLDWNSDEIKNIVRASRSHATRIGLLGTPSFFINGEQIQNPSSYEEFRSKIQAALDGQ